MLADTHTHTKTVCYCSLFQVSLSLCFSALTNTQTVHAHTPDSAPTSIQVIFTVRWRQHNEKTWCDLH